MPVLIEASEKWCFGRAMSAMTIDPVGAMASRPSISKIAAPAWRTLITKSSLSSRAAFWRVRSHCCDVNTAWPIPNVPRSSQSIAAAKGSSGVVS
ncbi:hypothetical protein [Sphingomonas sp. DC2300-3]|uniref:hypothetical protein n=1 Tax=unclassified Sphingomonas TaxID=196159 RepID=UPI003CE86D67